MVARDGYPAEFRLVAACCRWPRSDARDAAVRDAASGPLDWAKVLQVARRHRVEGLVHDGLKSADVDVPPEAAAELSAEASRIALQNLLFAAECGRLAGALEGAGIPFLVLKGLTLNALAYGTLALKKAWDIDIVVTEGAVGQACGVLAEAGYERTLPGPEVGPEQFQAWLAASKDMIWTHKARNIPVELHRDLVDSPRMLPGVSAETPPQRVEIAPGIVLPTLPIEPLFAYLCIHGATHAWSRLKWIADVAALLCVRAEGETERLYRASAALGAGRAAGQALLLSERLFGLPLPPALKAELEGDRKVRWLASLAMGTLLKGEGAEESDLSLLGTVPMHLSQLLLVPGWRYKGSEVIRKSSSPMDRVEFPLPRRAHFLYPLLLVPLWLWRRARISRVR
jgi:hypothetical protein